MSSLLRFHYDPFTGFDPLLDDVFSAPFWSPVPPTARAIDQRTGAQPLASFRPRLDLHETEGSNLVTATFELPGLTSEDVTIDIHNNRLTISGESSASNDSDSGEYAIRERRCGKFTRTLQLPVGTKPEDITAKVQNGLLTVTFPKAIHEQQPHRIAIH